MVCLWLMLLAYPMGRLHAQCTLSGTVTIGLGGTYPTFNGPGGFFEAVNTSGLSGNLTARVISDITETASTPLNAHACGAWSIQVEPSSAALRTISGTNGTASIILNGISNIHFNGNYLGSGQYLLFRDMNGTGASGQPVFWFRNGTDSVSVSNCRLETAVTSAAAGAAGVVLAGPAASGNGVSSITLSGNIIRNRSDLPQNSSNLVANGVLCQGTGSGTGLNSGIVISGNEIFNFSNGGVYIPTFAGPNFSVTGNKFYNAIATGTSQYGIYLSSPSTSHSNTLSGNVISGNAADGSGTWIHTGTNTQLWGIHVNVGGATPAEVTTISGNTIRNIWSQALSLTNFRGIHTVAGMVNILNNTIGQTGIPNSIQVDGRPAGGGAAVCYVYGIWNQSASPCTISGNTVAGLRTQDGTAAPTVTADGQNFICAIRHGSYERISGAASATPAGKVTMTNNLVSGIYAKTVVSGPINTFDCFPGGCSGIMVISSATDNLIDKNTVNGIYAYRSSTVTATAYSVMAVGMSISGTSGPSGGGGVVSRNVVCNVTNATGSSVASSQPLLYGIHVGDANLAGRYTFVNNMVALTPTGTNTIVRGINDATTASNSGANNYYYNSIWVGGSNTGSNSSCGFRATPANVSFNTSGGLLSIKNNIFINSRTGGTGANRVFENASSDATRLVGWPVGASDYNFLATASSTAFGGWGLTAVSNFASWQSTTGSDLNSRTAGVLTSGVNNTTGPVGSINPLDLWVSPAAGDLHIKTSYTSPYPAYSYITDWGVSLPGYVTDFDLDARPSGSGYDIGADEWLSACATAIAGAILPGDTSFCSATSLILSLGSYSTGGGSTYEWQSAPAGSGSFVAAGGTTPTSFPTGVLSTSTDFRVKVMCATDGSTAYSDTMTVTIGDFSPPTAICRDITVGIGASGYAVIVPADVNNGSWDNCSPTGSLHFAISADSFACAQLGVNAVTLTVTDTSGNSSTCVSNVTVESPAFSAGVSSTLLANGYHLACVGDSNATATASVSGGCPGYDFAWSNGDTTASINGLDAGTYTVTITEAGGQSDTLSIVITEPATALAAGASWGTVSCVPGSDGWIDLTPTGGSPGYSYLWSNSATSQDISGLVPGTYTVTITDTVGCTFVISDSVSAAPSIATAATTTPETCVPGADGTIDLAVSGGTAPFALLWSNGSTTEDLSGLVAGAYSVTVTDSLGCESVLTANVLASSGPGTPTISESGDTLFCSPASALLSYQWYLAGSPIAGADTTILLPSTDGAYTVVVTDSNGCSDTSAVFLVVDVAASFMSSAMHVWPNPSLGEFMISWDGMNPQLISVRIMDAAGRVVLHRKQTGPDGTMLISLAEAVPGIYFLVASAGGETTVFKIAVY